MQFIAKNRKLSVDRSDEAAADKYSVKLFAMKNATMYLPLTGPVTLETASEFVESAADSKSDPRFLIAPSEIALIKVSSGRINQQQRSERRDPRVKNRESKTTSTTEVEDDDTTEVPSDETIKRSKDEEGNADDRERARILREAEIRERMAQEERDYLFEESRGSSAAADEEAEIQEEEQEEIIEL